MSPQYSRKTIVPLGNPMKDAAPPQKAAEPFFESKEPEPFFTPRVQSKLFVNNQDDHYEQEADTIADKAVSAMSKKSIGAAGGDTSDQNAGNGRGNSISRLGAGRSGLQRKPGDEDERKSFSIVIPPGTKSRLEFHRYAELKIFGRVVNVAWQPNAGTEAIYKDISKHAGTTIIFSVSVSSLNKYKTDSKNGKHSDDGYDQMGEADKNAVNAEIDKRYYDSTGITPGTKINAGEQGRAEIWNDFKRQVMEQKKQLDDLPPAVKSFLQSDKTFTPDNYAKLNQIASLLNQFSAADFLDYKSKVNFETSDLEELRRSISNYLQQKQERRKQDEKRETIKTRIFGLEDLYKKYKHYKEMEGSSQSIPSADEFGVHDRNRDIIGQWEENAANAFHASLKAHGFKNTAEFETYISNYEESFRQETIAIAGDHLQRYRHKLFEEEKKLTDDTYISTLFTQIQQSGAKTRYDNASSKHMQAAMALGKNEFPSDALLHRQLELNREGDAEQAAGDQSLTQLPAASPLMKEEKFDKRKLAGVKSKEELKTIFREYIAEKRESIDETWSHIQAKPDRIYELDNLVVASMRGQQISEGSIFDMIIKDKMKALGKSKLLKAICFVVICLALAIASFGTGTPAILAAAGSLGLSLYAVHEELEKYKHDSNAHDVGLLSEDPTLTWVILAIVGAGLDTAAVASAFKAAKPIAEATTAFNKNKDLLALEKSLAKLSDVDAKIQQNIMRAAKAELAFKESVEGLFKTSGTLNVMLIPGAEGLAKLTVVAYYAIKRGIISFEKFLLELKAQNIIKEIDALTPEELNMCKQAFEKARTTPPVELEQLAARVEQSAAKQEAPVTDAAKDMSVKGEPVKNEPVKTEPVKEEPVKGETADQGPKEEPVKTEPVKTEPVKEGPPKNESTKTASGQQEAPKSSQDEVALSGNIVSLADQLKARLLKRLELTNGKLTLRHSDAELIAMIKKGKELGHSEKLIEDFIYISCRNDKPLHADEVMKQMEYYIFVKKRGYPEKFKDLAEFETFRSEVKADIEALNLG